MMATYKNGYFSFLLICEKLSTGKILVIFWTCGILEVVKPDPITTLRSICMGQPPLNVKADKALFILTIAVL